MREELTKNGKSRVIAIDEDVKSFLKGYCYYKIRTAQEPGYESGDYLFTDDEGSLIHPDTFTKHLRKIYVELGFPSEFHLHTIRHYFVTTILHSDVDKQTVTELAGYGDTSILERTYCHPQMELKHKASKAMAQIIEALGQENIKYETYFKLVISTGMRRGECCGLKWSDFDYNDHTIHIHRNVLKLTGEDIIVKAPKTAAGDRYVYFSAEMESLLEDYRKYCEDEAEQSGRLTPEEQILMKSAPT